MKQNLYSVHSKNIEYAPYDARLFYDPINEFRALAFYFPKEFKFYFNSLDFVPDNFTEDDVLKMLKPDCLRVIKNYSDGYQPNTDHWLLTDFKGVVGLSNWMIQFGADKMFITNKVNWVYSSMTDWVKEIKDNFNEIKRCDELDLLPRKFTDGEVQLVKDLFTHGISIRELAFYFNTTKDMISRLLKKNLSADEYERASRDNKKRNQSHKRTDLESAQEITRIMYQLGYNQGDIYWDDQDTIYAKDREDDGVVDDE